MGIFSIEEFIQKNKTNEFSNNTRKNGLCSKCGECCSNFLPLALSEILRIKSFISEHHITAINHAPNGYIDGMCPFLNHEKLCTIYDIRPLICKVFKCNIKKPQFKDLKLFLQEERNICDVRFTFFGDNQGLPSNFFVNTLISQRRLL